MEYTQDMEQLAEWAPLVVQGRDRAQEIAATRVTRGTDVDFGVLARAMFGHLQSGGRLRLHLLQEVTDLGRSPDGRWRVTVRDRTSASRRQISARFVFLGAGGGALPLLLRSGIPEGRGYGGFPVSGLWLVCNRAEVAERHQAKVYGKASVGAPPMSVPHLDTRHIDGRRTLLFGPFAGFSTKFLKAGSYLDLPRSLGPGNVLPMIGAGLGNAGLIGYLVGQVLQSPSDRMAALRAFMPTAEDGDWQLAVAGQRVQIIKKAPGRLGKLEFGTEVVAAGDGSIAALLGASPGASTAVVTMTDIVRRCFVADGGPDREEALRRIVPTLGLELPADGAQLARLRARNNEVLEIGG
jgi:malate dehydrogenase (quinone)